MMADTAAMAVDTCTYALNLLTERLKATYSPRQRLQLEFATPLLSVLVLAGVNVYFIRKASQTLIQHPHLSPSDAPKPTIMLTFSIFNLFLDAVNMTCFARAKAIMGFEVGAVDAAQHHNIEHSDDEKEDLFLYKNEEIALEPTTANHYEVMLNPSLPNHNDVDDDAINLNMCSAYTVRYCIVSIPYYKDHLSDRSTLFLTPCNILFQNGSIQHIFADTLRSIAVISAACIAEFVEGVESNQADAIATLIVSFLIFLSLLPLLTGLYYSALKLREEIYTETDELELMNKPQCIT
jgi:Co/Zn/Cd efflux system component